MTPDLSELARKCADHIHAFEPLKQAVEQGERERAELQNEVSVRSDEATGLAGINNDLRAELSRVKAQNQVLTQQRDTLLISLENTAIALVSYGRECRATVAAATSKLTAHIRAILAEAQKEGEVKECRKDS
jgi:hypothetical protein